jgi:hypothetical protein
MCNWQLEEGQEYHRWVWRQGSSKLFVSVCHADDRDCPWLEEEELLHEEHAQMNMGVSIPIEMVISSRVVAKVGVHGETIYCTEPFVEMKTADATSESEENSEPYNPDTKDEIPF